MSLSDMRKYVVEWWNGSVAPMVESAGTQKYAREFVIIFGLGAFIIASFWGYRYYTAHQEAAAQIAFAQGVQAYNEAGRGGSIRWPQVELLLQAGYEQHQKSTLAAYFLVYKADVQVKMGKLPEAVETLATALAQLPKDSPFLRLYQMKYALMRMDLPDEAAQKEGLESLRALALDKDNKNNDAALYYLGLYYWGKDDRAQAATTWKELVAVATSKEPMGNSPWAQLAQEKLAAAGQELAEVA
jgi:predicted negative regulator of RcsB-dependent stress response